MPLNGAKASVKWTPELAVSKVEIEVKITTLAGTSDLENGTKSKSTNFMLNKPPVAAMIVPTEANSGQVIAFKSTGSTDEGSIVEFKWEFGDGKSLTGASVNYGYVLPGTYTIKLTVTDNLGAKTSIQNSIIVIDTRPDLYVEDIIWSPTDPNEKDVVTIKAIIGNRGKGTSTMSFLTGFYIDNQYMGYVASYGDLEVGKTKEVTFSWVATAGSHVVKIIANDILDNLKEIDKGNNSKTVALSSTQVSFADVRINSITWAPEGNIYSSQEPFEYRSEIENIGDRAAEAFSVALYIDDVYMAKKVINKLEPGAKTTVSFPVIPTDGVHRVKIVADDPSPVLIELDTANNSMTIDTDEFIVEYPTIEIGEITWEPKETSFADGTSLSFEVPITNNSRIAITRKFNASIAVDGIIIRTMTVDGLKPGETKKITGRWVAKEKEDKTRSTVVVTVDLEGKVLENSSLTKTVTLPVLKIVYPNLNITTVNWSPLTGSYNNPMTFIASIGNESLASIFKRFTIGLYVREAGSSSNFTQVTGAPVDGLRGYSTAFVPLTWTPNRAGSYEYKIVTDIYGEV